MTVPCAIGRFAGVRRALPQPSFRWQFTDAQSLAPGRGSGTFAVTRATNTAQRVTAAGLYEVVNADLPRFSLEPDGVMRLLVEEQRINLCPRSEDFSAGWSAVGTPTRSGGAKTCGTLSMDLLGDDAAGTLEGYTQTVSFTGNAVKAVSVHIAKDTSTSTVFRLRDTTAPADRLLAAVTWSGSTPVVTMTTGTHLLTETLGNSVFRIHFQTTSVTAANTNSMQVYPATDAALAVGGTGNAYIGGIQCENATFPSSYVETAAGTVTRNADVVVLNPFTLPATGVLVVRARTHALDGASDATIRIAATVSDGTANERHNVQRDASSQAVTPTTVDGGASQLTGLSRNIAANTRVATAYGYGTNNASCSINGQAVQTDATVTLPTVNRMHAGSDHAGAASFWCAGIESIVVYGTRLADGMLPQLCNVN